MYLVNLVDLHFAIECLISANNILDNLNITHFSMINFPIELKTKTLAVIFLNFKKFPLIMVFRRKCL